MNAFQSYDNANMFIMCADIVIPAIIVISFHGMHEKIFQEGYQNKNEPKMYINDK